MTVSIRYGKIAGMSTADSNLGTRDVFYTGSDALIASLDASLTAHTPAAKRTRTMAWTKCGKRISMVRITYVNPATLTNGERYNRTPLVFTACGC